ncbi:MAG TPA: DUF58 domain-containing protein [Alphaproteobacteria bacterium]|nr:DUF58 domain-containing protein [Alphaproteobacteria bacterium]
MTAPDLIRKQQRAEALAATLPPLLVAAERVAATVAQGVHGRRRVGMGESFWQFRRYQPGDQLQSVDWRQTGKSQAVFVRELEWEASQSVWLWRDASASMEYRSTAALPFKRERAEILLLALASLLNRAGERVALMGGEGPPVSGRANLVQLAMTLGRGTPIEPMPDRLPRHAELVLIGDFLAPLAEAEALVGACAQRAVRGHILQVLDPAEATLPFGGRIRFKGMETGEEETLIPRVETIRGAYLGRMRSQQEGLAALARSAGWSFGVHRTDKPAQLALLGLYGALSRTPIPRGEG